MKAYKVTSTWDDLLVRARNFEHALKKARKHYSKIKGLKISITAITLTSTEVI